MCITSAEVRAWEEDAFLSVLCEKCLDKVDRKLQGTDKTLFDFDSEEYGFCQKCLRKIDLVAAELSEYWV